MYMPGRLRTASSPSRTVMSSASYPAEPVVSSGVRSSGAKGPPNTAESPGSSPGVGGPGLVLLVVTRIAQHGDGPVALGDRLRLAGDLRAGRGREHALDLRQERGRRERAGVRAQGVAERAQRAAPHAPTPVTIAPAHTDTCATPGSRAPGT